MPGLLLVHVLITLDKKVGENPQAETDKHHCKISLVCPCLMLEQHLKINGKNFQFKGSFEDVTLKQQSERLQLTTR